MHANVVTLTDERRLLTSIQSGFLLSGSLLRSETGTRTGSSSLPLLHIPVRKRQRPVPRTEEVKIYHHCPRWCLTDFHCLVQQLYFGASLAQVLAQVSTSTEAFRSEFVLNISNHDVNEHNYNNGCESFCSLSSIESNSDRVALSFSCRYKVEV